MHALIRPALIVAAPSSLLRGAAALVSKVFARARQRRALAGLDARSLCDIGLTRAQAVAEARRPFWKA